MRGTIKENTSKSLFFSIFTSGVVCIPNLQRKQWYNSSEINKKRKLHKGIKIIIEKI